MVQLKILFDTYNHSDNFLPVLEMFGFDVGYNFAMTRKMFFEAASLSLDANKKNMFEDAMLNLRDTGKRDKLMAKAALQWK